MKNKTETAKDPFTPINIVYITIGTLYNLGTFLQMQDSDYRK